MIARVAVQNKKLIWILHGARYTKTQLGLGGAGTQLKLFLDSATPPRVGPLLQILWVTLIKQSLLKPRAGILIRTGSYNNLTLY